MLEPTLSLIEEHRGEVISALKILLPKLANGWEKQRGDSFQFGDKQDAACSMKIANYDQEKLN